MTTIAAPTDRDRPLPGTAAPGTAARRLDGSARRAAGRLARCSCGDLLMLAGTVTGVLVGLAVLALAWHRLGVARGWHPAAWAGIGLVTGWLAGQVPVFVTTYLVWRRRLMRQVEADLFARRPDRHR